MLFFDLEFYVPPSGRTAKRSLIYNPGYQDHLCLGGVFAIHPLEHPLPHDLTKVPMKSLWLWDYPSEKALLKDILAIFKNDLRHTQKMNEKSRGYKIRDNLLYGIGISRIDLPVLYIRANYNRISSPSELFSLLFNTRSIDFSNVCSPFFASDYLYPITANEITKALNLPQEPKESGKKIWDYYDKGEFHKITSRCEGEVLDIIRIYQKLVQLDPKKFRN